MSMKALRGLKIEWRTNLNGQGRKISVPVIDVRNGRAEREEAALIEKASREKHSRYIPNRQWSKY